MLETIKTTWKARIVTIVFLLFTAFWVYLQLVIPTDTEIHTFFGAIYGVMAILGMIFGILISIKWGFMSSIIGRAIAMFSFGLMAQEFGQLTLSYFHYVLGKEGLYPSLGDVGFFGSIPLYIYGVILLAQASGVKIRLQSFASKVQALIIPLGVLAAGYYLFLQGYEFDWSDPVKIFLDFGYPLGQAFYVSLAILTYLLSRGVLGGIMKTKILCILFALIIQFFADYTFLYQSSRGIWHVGEINDYMYLGAYFIMTLSLIQFETVFKNIKHE
jgi:hypothetical protein